jgi:hypothetical protein
MTDEIRRARDARKYFKTSLSCAACTNHVGIVRQQEALMHQLPAQPSRSLSRSRHDPCTARRGTCVDPRPPAGRGQEGRAGPVLMQASQQRARQLGYRLAILSRLLCAGQKVIAFHGQHLADEREDFGVLDLLVGTGHPIDEQLMIVHDPWARRKRRHKRLLASSRRLRTPGVRGRCKNEEPDDARPVLPPPSIGAP